MPAAYDIYTEQLRELRRGDALYHPEPALGQMPVEIGDVGFTKQGAFCRLFNASRPVADPINAQFGVPHDFQLLDLGNPQTYVAELEPGPLYSKTVSQANFDVGVPARCVSVAV